MIITIDRNQLDGQYPIVTIDLKTCYYPYAIRNALELALELNGYTKETIAEIFNKMPEVNCETT